MTCVDPSAAMLEMAAATLQRRSSRIDLVFRLHGSRQFFSNIPTRLWHLQPSQNVQPFATATMSPSALR